MNPWADRIEFHNCHAESREGGLLQLARYPEHVRNSLNERARIMSLDACGAELRFVTSATNIYFTMTAETADIDLHIYRGPFLHITQRLVKGVPTLVHLTPPERFPEATDAALNSGGWSPDVWRVCIGRSSVLFHNLNTFGHPVRPPTGGEKPSIAWLAYGSSITHSSQAGYPFHAARLLHWDLSAKGLSGACHIEKEASDYLAAHAAEIKAGIITAELGVNMRGDVEPDDFAARSAYLVKAIRAANPTTPLVLITAFTNSAHQARVPREDFQRQHAFDARLRELVAGANDRNLHLIEGSELLPDFTLLGADVLHPTPSGHALMGHLLAERLRKLVG